MRKLFLVLFCLLALSKVGNATTYYIRHDGGTNVQCTGTTNAAYPGSGTGLPCAFNHPYQLVSYTGGWQALVAGDTVIFADPPTNTTPYYMGEQNGGLGFDWGAGGSGPLGGICPAPNSGSGAVSCIMPPLPDNTTWIGQNAGSCHTPGHTGLVNPTILSGISWAYNVLDMQGTTGVSISCIEITQPDNCNREGVGSGGGCSTSANIVSEAGIRYQDYPALGPTNLTMTDVMCGGLSTACIHGSYTVGTINGTDLYVWGNGDAGIDSDGGGCGTSCESVGTWNYNYIDVEANGCVLVKPFDNTQGPTSGTNGFNNCFGQNTGGYGDGFVIIASGALTVNVNHSKFKDNTQDGFDGLHISDDTTSPISNISNSWSEGNAGAAFKFGVGVSVTDEITNNIGIANCRILGDSSAFPNNPPGWIVLDGGDQCRAAGDQWSFQLSNGSFLDLRFNSMAGYGTTMLELGCGALQLSCGANGAIVHETNDTHFGYGDPGNAGVLASGWNLEAGVPMPVLAYNHWYSMKSGCPDNTITGETNYICTDPLWVAESNVDALNPNLTAPSPLIGAGITISGVTLDYNGFPRPNPPAIGAFEFNGGLPVFSTHPIFSAPHH